VRGKATDLARLAPPTRGFVRLQRCSIGIDRPLVVGALLVLLRSTLITRSVGFVSLRRGLVGVRSRLVGIGCALIGLRSGSLGIDRALVCRAPRHPVVRLT
jgi:hypothetical protein